MGKFELSSFIKKHVTGRASSFFQKDIVNHQESLIEGLQSKRILVIGGAGSIGSQFIKAISKYKPSSIVVVDTNENGLAEVVRDLRSGSFEVPSDFRLYPFSYHSDAFYRLFDHEDRFDLVANFAAHKHVRSEKDPFSIDELLKNNFINAGSLLNKLLEKKPDHYFSVSTDKAANPVNVMGASKRLMEKLMLAYSDDINISTARFANVAFSNGSLFDGYLSRLLKNQPLSCPSDIKRYFISPQESGELCMMASVLGNNRQVFFPKLSEELDLKNLADISLDFIKSNGYEVEICDSEQAARYFMGAHSEQLLKYPIYLFKSDTSGEKPFEEFYTAQEERILDKYEALGFIQLKKEEDVQSISSYIDDFKNLLKTGPKKEEIIAMIQHKIPNFGHIETGKNLDQKM